MTTDAATLRAIGTRMLAERHAAAVPYCCDITMQSAELGLIDAHCVRGCNTTIGLAPDERSCPSCGDSIPEVACPCGKRWMKAATWMEAT